MRGRMHNTERMNKKPILGATHRAKGGKVDVYEGAGSNVAKEAEEKKNGGKVSYAGGNSNVAKEAMEKKKGGSVKKHMKVGGHAAKHNMAHRKRGGSVKHASGGRALAAYSTKHPMSEAGKVKGEPGKEEG